MNETFQAKNDVMEEALTTEGVLNIQCKYSMSKINVFLNMSLFTDAPRVEVSPESASLKEGEILELECIIDANPKNVSSVEWQKDGEPVETNDGAGSGDGENESDSVIREIDEIRKLTISNIQRNFKGSYSCHAENIVGVSESDSEASIDVICKYKHVPKDVRIHNKSLLQTHHL